MKIKLSWPFFVPFFALSVGLKIYQTAFFPEGGTFLGMNISRLNYFIVLLSVALFLLMELFNKIDKTTSDAYISARSIPVGVLSLLCAAAVLVNAGSDAIGMISSADYSVLWFVNDILGVLAAIGFVVISAAMFGGRNNSRGISFIYAMPAIWAASKLIAMFSEFTSLSVRSVDMTVIVAYVFLTMFLFYQAVTLIALKEKDGVKKNFVFGLPAVSLLAVCLTSAVIRLMYGQTALSLESVAFPAELFLLALYVLVYLISMSRRLITVEDAAKLDSEATDAQYDISEDVRHAYRDIADNLEAEEEEDSSFTVAGANAGGTDAEKKAEAAPAEPPQKSPASGNANEFDKAKQMLDRLIDDFE